MKDRKNARCVLEDYCTAEISGFKQPFLERKQTQGSKRNNIIPQHH
jgi:hypothetical protein